MPKESSCKGINNTQMTKDCVTYCDSSAGRNIISYLTLLEQESCYSAMQTKREGPSAMQARMHGANLWF